MTESFLFSQAGLSTFDFVTVITAWWLHERETGHVWAKGDKQEIDISDNAQHCDCSRQ